MIFFWLNVSDIWPLFIKCSQPHSVQRSCITRFSIKLDIFMHYKRSFRKHFLIKGFQFVFNVCSIHLLFNPLNSPTEREKKIKLWLKHWRKKSVRTTATIYVATMKFLNNNKLSVIWSLLFRFVSFSLTWNWNEE